MKMALIVEDREKEKFSAFIWLENLRILNLVSLLVYRFSPRSSLTEKETCNQKYSMHAPVLPVRYM